VASFFVAPNGSDSNPCTQALPCKSFDRGYHVAAPGQVIEVAGGSYPEQNVLYDASKEGAQANVVFRPAVGASVTVAGIDASTSRSVKGATHMTVHGPMNVNGAIVINGCGSPTDGQQCSANSGGNYLDFDHLTITNTYGFVCFSCDHISLTYSTIQGSAVYGSACPNAGHPEISTAYDSKLFRKDKRPNHFVFDHDIFQNFARCDQTQHVECLQTEPADDITISNSVFRRCDTIALNLTENSGNSLSASGHRESNNILVENNFIGQATDRTSADGLAYFSLRIPNGTNVTVRNNSWTDSPLFYSGSGGFISQGYKITGNVGPYNGAGANCGNGMSFSHNVFSGTLCGGSGKLVSSFGFSDPSPAGLDLHLLAGSPAIDAGDPSSYPTSDLDGQARPMGGIPDAGADERQ
jgi:hypothetical protein